MKELPETSKRVLQIVEDIIRDQNSKGLTEYGQTIDEAEGYDWKLEALLECVDSMQYMTRHILDLEKENKRIKEENEKLKEAQASQRKV